MTPIRDFGRTAIHLSRNPLGILALFQVLIYGIAAFVTSNINSANTSLLSPLIWFLVLFPFAVLGVFVFLVSKHHNKLYAPSDYSNENNFMRSAGVALPYTADEFTEKIKSEEETAAVLIVDERDCNE